MDIPSIKIELIKWLTNLQDKSMLEKLQGLKQEQEATFELSLEQEKEIDERLEKYESGKTHFSSWGEVKGKIKNRGR